MQTKNGIHPGRLESPFLNQFLGASRPFFVGLKNKFNRPRERTFFRLLRQTKSRRQEHRRVSVVTTRMHHTTHAGPEGNGRALVQRQSIHVRPESHARARTALQSSDNTRGSMPLKRDFGRSQNFFHERGCLKLAMTQLWILVNTPPKRNSRG
jgi:hypothetical protein